MFYFAEVTKDMTAVEILNYYRNLYYAEPQVTERGIVANAINDILSRMIVPPCKVGDKVYSVSKSVVKSHWVNNQYIIDEWDTWKVRDLPFSLTLWENGKMGNDYFLSREEAEKALAERSAE